MNMRIERLVLLGALAIVLLIVVSTGFYTVAESEQAVVTTFGKVTSVTGAGLHLKLPWPIQARVNVPVNRTNKIELGYREIGDGYYESVDEESMMITGDLNIVNIDFFIEWRISDPVKYLYASEDPETILRNIAQGSVRSVVGTKTIDETLTVGKTQIQIEVKDSMLQTLDLYDIGVMVLEVKVNDSEPPTEEVAAAFRGVETAKQEKETSINQALEYRNGMLPAARPTRTGSSGKPSRSRNRGSRKRKARSPASTPCIRNTSVSRTSPASACIGKHLKRSSRASGSISTPVTARSRNCCPSRVSCRILFPAMIPERKGGNDHDVGQKD